MYPLKQDGKLSGKSIIKSEAVSLHAQCRRGEPGRLVLDHLFEAVTVTASL
jgi:hypothetical protein